MTLEEPKHTPLSYNNLAKLFNPTYRKELGHLNPCLALTPNSTGFCYSVLF